MDCGIIFGFSRVFSVHLRKNKHWNYTPQKIKIISIFTTKGILSWYRQLRWFPCSYHTEDPQWYWCKAVPQTYWGHCRSLFWDCVNHLVTIYPSSPRSAHIWQQKWFFKICSYILQSSSSIPGNVHWWTLSIYQTQWYCTETIMVKYKYNVHTHFQLWTLFCVGPFCIFQCVQVVVLVSTLLLVFWENNK